MMLRKGNCQSNLFAIRSDIKLSLHLLAKGMPSTFLCIFLYFIFSFFLSLFVLKQAA